MAPQRGSGGFSALILSLNKYDVWVFVLFNADWMMRKP
jgi:hypothetical protein